jgi:hypothetical protein
MPPNPEKSNTILRNELMVEVGWSCSRCIRRVDQTVRGCVTPAAAFVAAVPSQPRISKPEAGRLLSVVAYRLLFFCCGFGAAWLTGRLILDEIAYERKVREQMRPDSKNRQLKRAPAPKDE